MFTITRTPLATCDRRDRAGVPGATVAHRAGRPRPLLKRHLDNQPKPHPIHLPQRKEWP